MIFCGQCGLQLPPGSTRCPRCGALVEENEATRGSQHIDDPTVASPSFIARHPSGPGQPSIPGAPGMAGTPPQQLVLRPGTSDYNTQGANDATSMMEASGFNTRGVPTPPNMGGSFVGGGYPGQGSYVDYGTQGGGSSYRPTSTVYPGGMGSSMGYGQEQTGAHENKGLRTAGLVIVVLGMLLILSAVILFALQQNGMLARRSGGSGGPGGSTMAGTTAGPDQAQRVIQQYYAAINRQDYQAAYSLWKNNPRSFNDFSDGFQNTKGDQLTIAQTEELGDGTVKITVTVQAIEASSNGKFQNTYGGYYIVGQDDNAWKIFDASLHKK